MLNPVPLAAADDSVARAGTVIDAARATVTIMGTCPGDPLSTPLACPLFALGARVDELDAG